MKIIAFEGNDGSGKGLQFDILTRRLKDLKKNVKTLSFPQYDKFFGKEIGQMLSGANEVSAVNVDAKSMSLWYALDRAQAFNNLDLTGVDYLLLNRYVLSNVVYQSLRLSNLETEQLGFAKWVFELEHEQLKLPRPDLYIVLDVNETLSKQNVAKKGFRDYVGEKADVYETSENLLKNVRMSYLKCAKTVEHVKIIKCMENDKMIAPDVISDAIYDEIAERFDLN